MDGNKIVLDALSAAIIRVDELVPVEVEYPSDIVSPVINENGTVTFNFLGDASTESVNVAGSFNGWDATAFAMTKGEDDVWSVTVDLTPGVYEYKFVVNGGDWINDPANDAIVGDDGNNQLILPGLMIEGNHEAKPGTTVTLTATYVNADGEIAEVDAEYALVSRAVGVTIAGNKITISEDISPGTVITIVGTYGESSATYSITVTGDSQAEAPGTEVEDGSDTDSNGDGTTEEDKGAAEDLPATGETNNLIFALLGLVFIGGGTALAFTFKKKERTD